jgi:hypothetical protein
MKINVLEKFRVGYDFPQKKDGNMKVLPEMFMKISKL